MSKISSVGQSELEKQVVSHFQTYYMHTGANSGLSICLTQQILDCRLKKPRLSTLNHLLIWLVVGVGDQVRSASPISHMIPLWFPHDSPMFPLSFLSCFSGFLIGSQQFSLGSHSRFYVETRLIRWQGIVRQTKTKHFMKYESFK